MINLKTIWELNINKIKNIQQRLDKNLNQMQSSYQEENLMNEIYLKNK